MWVIPAIRPDRCTLVSATSTSLTIAVARRPWLAFPPPCRPNLTRFPEGNSGAIAAPGRPTPRRAANHRRGCIAPPPGKDALAGPLRPEITSTRGRGPRRTPHDSRSPTRSHRRPEQEPPGARRVAAPASGARGHAAAPRRPPAAGTTGPPRAEPRTHGGDPSGFHSTRRAAATRGQAVHCLTAPAPASGAGAGKRRRAGPTRLAVKGGAAERSDPLTGRPGLLGAPPRPGAQRRDQESVPTEGRLASNPLHAPPARSSPNHRAAVAHPDTLSRVRLPRNPSRG